MTQQDERTFKCKFCDEELTDWVCASCRYDFRHMDDAATGRAITLSDEELTDYFSVEGTREDKGWVPTVLPDEDDLEKAWRQLAEDLGGEFARADALRGLSNVALFGLGTKDATVSVKVSDWEVQIQKQTDPNSSDYTRIIAPFISTDGFTFKITEKFLSSGAGSDFDKRFNVKGKDKSKVRILVANERLLRLVSIQPTIVLVAAKIPRFFRRNRPKGSAQLWFVDQTELITDVERLKGLVELFGVVLDQLRALGSAEPPPAMASDD